MYFFLKTNNPRPTFHLDMTPEERQTMQRHVAYWSDKAQRGEAIVFGPVMDPNGVYGIGVYNAPDQATMDGWVASDPANGLLAYEILPMGPAVVGTLK